MATKEELEKKVQDYENDLNKPDQNKKKKSMLKYLLNISFVLIVTVVSITLTLWGNTGTIMNNLRKCNPLWLLAIVGVMALTMIIRSFVLFCFARLFTHNYHIHQALACDQIGQFYNAVTPGASGGQIMQAYTYKKQGVPISSAVSALAMYSIMFQIVLIIYNIVAFIFKFDLIMKIDVAEISLNNGGTLHIPIIVLTIIGFLLNLGVIMIVLLMGYWHAFHNFVMGPIISLLAKMHILKNPDKTRENLRIQVENFKIEFRRLITNIPFTILVFVCFAFYMTLKFSIPYFCGLALGSEHVGIS
ncbi:MAG: flippase-like domain-containing protein, partial [Bacilli bacterium]|nr:flippase-like domain-containing protein [Bacilli bacterium]